MKYLTLPESLYDSKWNNVIVCMRTGILKENSNNTQAWESKKERERDRETERQRQRQRDRDRQRQTEAVKKSKHLVTKLTNIYMSCKKYHCQIAEVSGHFTITVMMDMWNCICQNPRTKHNSN